MKIIILALFLFFFVACGITKTENSASEMLPTERITKNTTTTVSDPETPESIQLKEHLNKTYSNMSWHRQINYIRTKDEVFYVHTYLSVKDQNAVEICKGVKSYVFGAKNTSNTREVVIQNVTGEQLILLKNSKDGCGKPNVITKVEKPQMKEPVIGMGYEEFLKLCGRPNKSRSYESKNGITLTYEYEYNEQRAKSGCWGTFRFFDFKIESISQ